MPNVVNTSDGVAVAAKLRLNNHVVDVDDIGNIKARKGPVKVWLEISGELETLVHCVELVGLLSSPGWSVSVPNVTVQL